MRGAQHVVAGLCVALFCSCAGTVTVGPGPAPQPAFTVTVNPGIVTAAPGATTAAVLVTVTGSNGFSGNVVVTVTGLPAGITTSPPAPFAVAAGASQSITVSVPLTASPGNVALNLTGTSGLLSQSAALVLTIAGPGPAPVSDQVVLVGGVRSTDFPTTAGAIAASFQGGSNDGFISSVTLTSAGAATAFSTYWGGSGEEEVRDTFVDAQGNIYITGITNSPDLPTTAGAFQRVLGGGNDAFVAKLSPAGQLLASTYVGGTANDQGYNIFVDAAGFVYVGGRTSSPDYPVTAGAFRGPGTYGGGMFDMVITKLRPDLSGIVWATYIGGSGTDTGRGRLAVDASGNVVMGGWTESSDFPQASGPLRGTRDSMIVKVSADGSQLLYARSIPGNETVIEDGATGGLALTAGGEAYVCGATSSPDFINVIGVYGGGAADAFVARLSASGQILALRYLGGNALDDCQGLALDAAGNVVVSTITDSTAGYPTTAGVFQGSDSGGRDWGVTKFSPDLSQIVFSTFVGASGDDTGDTVRAEVDGAGNVYFAGHSSSAGIPWITPGAVQSSFRGGSHDIVFVVLSADGRQVRFASYLGGSDLEICRSLRYRRN